MRKIFKLLLVISVLLGSSCQNSFAATKPIDEKVAKECRAIRIDDTSFYKIISQPLGPERDAANKSMGEKPEYVNCAKLTRKSWNEIKSGYTKSITDYNAILIKIVKELARNAPTQITCQKNGVIKKIEAKNPKCPSGFKKLY